MKSLTCALVLDMFLSSVGCVVMSLVHNERTKLTAGLFNGLAVAFLAAGLFAQRLRWLTGFQTCALERHTLPR
jgi:hypothetical protein